MEQSIGRNSHHFGTLQRELLLRQGLKEKLNPPIKNKTSIDTELLISI